MMVDTKGRNISIRKIGVRILKYIYEKKNVCIHFVSLLIHYNKEELGGIFNVLLNCTVRITDLKKKNH